MGSQKYRLKGDLIIIVVSFEVVLLDGNQVPNISEYADAITNILLDVTDEETVAIVKNGFALYRIPTLSEIIEIEQRLVALGLVIKA